MNVSASKKDRGLHSGTRRDRNLIALQSNFVTFPAIHCVHGDFWVLAENCKGEVIATYCFRLSTNSMLWFVPRGFGFQTNQSLSVSTPSSSAQSYYFGGEITHAGGLWMRPHAGLRPRYCSTNATVRPRHWHDPKRSPRSKLCRRPQGAVYGETCLWVCRRGLAGQRVGFRLGEPLFTSAILREPRRWTHRQWPSILYGLRFLELRKRPLVNQHHQMVDPPTIKSEGEQQARI